MLLLLIRGLLSRKPPPWRQNPPNTRGGFLDPLSGAQIFGFRDTFLDRFTSRNRWFEGAKTRFFPAAGGGRKFCTFMMVLPIEIAHFELKNSKFSGRRRRPKILASGADLGDLSSENKGGFLDSYPLISVRLEREQIVCVWAHNGQNLGFPARSSPEQIFPNGVLSKSVGHEWVKKVWYPCSESFRKISSNSGTISDAIAKHPAHVPAR